jgi:hypothetical protein
VVSTVSTKGLILFKSSDGSEFHTDFPQDAIQALDVALRYSPSLEYSVVSRSFFRRPEKQMLLNEQLELWYVHYQSLCLGCDENATLNLDCHCRLFMNE